MFIAHISYNYKQIVDFLKDSYTINELHFCFKTTFLFCRISGAFTRMPTSVICHILENVCNCQVSCRLSWWWRISGHVHLCSGMHWTAMVGIFKYVLINYKWGKFLVCYCGVFLIKNLTQ